LLNSAQPEINLDGSVMMRTPLFRRRNKQANRLAERRGGGQRRLIIHA
jgi:hypothetical protein